MAENLAERYRRAREAFEAGVKMGCTPREAAAKLRWDRAERALSAKMQQGPRAPAVVSEPQDEPAQPWFRRGDMA